MHLKIAENFFVGHKCFHYHCFVGRNCTYSLRFRKALAIGMITFTLICANLVRFAILTSLGTFLDDFITILENFKEKPLSSDLGVLIECPAPYAVLASQAKFRQGVGIATQILDSILRTTIYIANHSICANIYSDPPPHVFGCLSIEDFPLFEELVMANNGSYTLNGLEHLHGFDGFFSPPYQPIVLNRHDSASSNILLFCQGYNGDLGVDFNPRYSWSADPRFTEELCDYILNGENRDAFLNAHPFEISSPVPYDHSFQWMGKICTKCDNRFLGIFRIFLHIPTNSVR